jgi:O-succinylbenzoate synthase
VAEVLRERHRVDVTLSSALDTSVGLSPGWPAAAALPGPAQAAGLGTAALLAADVTHRPLLPVDGHVPVATVVPDRDLLDRHAAPADRQRWWRERLVRCHALLARQAPGIIVR